jgi:hypothetical protein
MFDPDDVPACEIQRIMDLLAAAIGCDGDLGDQDPRVVPCRQLEETEREEGCEPNRAATTTANTTTPPPKPQPSSSPQPNTSDPTNATTTGPGIGTGGGILIGGASPLLQVDASSVCADLDELYVALNCNNAPSTRMCVSLMSRLLLGECYDLTLVKLSPVAAALAEELGVVIKRPAPPNPRLPASPPPPTPTSPPRQTPASPSPPSPLPPLSSPPLPLLPPSTPQLDSPSPLPLTPDDNDAEVTQKP